MRLPRHAFGVPMHPLLVHFPISLWLAVPVLDVAALYVGPDPWWALALGATILGILIGTAAIVTGLLEYLEPSVVGIDLRTRGAAWHKDQLSLVHIHSEDVRGGFLTDRHGVDCPLPRT